MIVDPWGIVLATAPDTERVITADLDLERAGRHPRRLPSLANRRPAAYRWPRPTAADGGTPTARPPRSTSAA